VLDASDRFFSSPLNLIAPGDPRGMHDGWETRRRRGPGHDWVAIGLAAETEVERIEVDTTNFKGNYPDTCSLDARAARDTDTDEAGWSEVSSPHKLGPDGRFVFPIDPAIPATQVRLNIYPDGGVARVRVYGQVTDEGWRSFGVRWLNALTASSFEEQVLACCASPAWARGMERVRPFGDFESVLEASDAAWMKLSAEDRRPAFDAHPRIGDRAGSDWSQQEQAGTASADDETRRELEKGNRDYEARFGHVFLINASDKTAGGMLEELRQRLANDTEAELAETAEQQRQIARIRLEKLVRPPAAEASIHAG
jgi:allantoicase